MAAVRLAERLRHQPGLQPYVGVAHVAFEFCPGHESGDTVHDDNVHGAAAHEVLDDLQGLLTGVRLGDEERVHLDAALRGVGGVQCVLSVYVSGGAALTLRFRDDVAAERGLSRRLCSENLGDAPPWGFLLYPGPGPARWSPWGWLPHAGSGRLRPAA